MATAKKTILAALLFAIALILILPQVDLPSTTFNELDNPSAAVVKQVSPSFAAHSAVLLQEGPGEFLDSKETALPLRAIPADTPAASQNPVLRC